MPWVVNATDTGVEEGAPPQVHVARRLIAQALEAINAGEQCTAIDDEYGIAAMAVYTTQGPVCIQIGYVVHSRPELVSLMESYGARNAQVREIHWIYDIPIRPE
jgi:hypothetical protein